MKEFSVIFLKDPHASARQYSLSYKAVYTCFFLFFCGIVSLVSIYYVQDHKITQQQNQLEHQEIVRNKLQTQIDGFAGKEKHIAFLETYVTELKKTTYNSETALKKHIDNYKASINKLAGLHSYVCQTMDLECVEKVKNPDNPTQVITWMDQIYGNFETLAKTVSQFNQKKITIEDQEEIIDRLQNRIAQTEEQMQKHLQIVKNKEKGIDELSKRIHRVTGIAINLSDQFLPKENSSSNKGRGGPSVKEDPEADYNETSYLWRYIQETTQYYENVVKSVADLSKSIDQDSQLWRNTPTIRPIQYASTTDGYGRRRHPITGEPDFHQGLDFSAKRGTKIYAPADGVVTKSGYQAGYGRMVEINHGLGFYKNNNKKVYTLTRYGHMYRIKVKRGQKIKRGQLIGLVGSTGRSTGPHLHYEILINGKPINPMKLIAHFESHLKKKNRRK
ncbi:MAG: peptidoglycan DD-metalloendopeptidase family protein [SAR324 cluster bacterium]|nr:peptidoglycan DD-metalloendopeptidase family protein [SAR324 cluster bacterium]